MVSLVLNVINETIIMAHFSLSIDLTLKMLTYFGSFHKIFDLNNGLCVSYMQWQDYCLFFYNR